MKKHVKTLYVVVDALRYDYIKDDQMPFLHSLASKSCYVKRLVPSPGFCERVEILTGKENIETGYFTAIDRAFAERTTPFALRLLEYLRLVFEFLERNLGVYLLFRVRKKLTKLMLRKLYPDNLLPPFNIPLSIYSQFELSEDKVRQSEPMAFGVPSIVDQLKKTSRTVNFQAFTSLIDSSTLETDDDRLRFVRSDFFSSDDSVFFLYLGELDEQGHLLGPGSPEFKDVLKRFDSKLKVFLDDLLSQGDLNIVVLGDHGMSDVKHHIVFKCHVLREARELGLEDRRDLIIFCDSTAGRVWLTDSDSERRLRERLRTCSPLTELGLLFEDPHYEQYSVPKSYEAHGHILWIANDGVVISPDYFHGYFPPNGMHGYLPLKDENFGTAIFYSRNSKVAVVERESLSSVLALSDQFFEEW